MTPKTRSSVRLRPMRASISAIGQCRGLLDVDDIEAGKALAQLCDQRGEVDAGVRVDRHDGRTLAGGGVRGRARVRPMPPRPDQMMLPGGSATEGCLS